MNSPDSWNAPTERKSGALDHALAHRNANMLVGGDDELVPREACLRSDTQARSSPSITAASIQSSCLAVANRRRPSRLLTGRPRAYSSQPEVSGSTAV
jgi:hypothetical protein